MARRDADRERTHSRGPWNWVSTNLWILRGEMKRNLESLFFFLNKERRWKTKSSKWWRSKMFLRHSKVCIHSMCNCKCSLDRNLILAKSVERSKADEPVVSGQLYFLFLYAYYTSITYLSPQELIGPWLTPTFFFLNYVIKKRNWILGVFPCP